MSSNCVKTYRPTPHADAECIHCGGAIAAGDHRATPSSLHGEVMGWFCSVNCETLYYATDQPLWDKEGT